MLRGIIEHTLLTTDDSSVNGVSRILDIHDSGVFALLTFRRGADLIHATCDLLGPLPSMPSLSGDACDEHVRVRKEKRA